MSTQALVCIASTGSDAPEREMDMLISACGGLHACRSWQGVGVALAVGASVEPHNPRACPQLFKEADRVLARVGDGLDWDPTWSMGSLFLQNPATNTTRLTSRRFATALWDGRTRRLIAARDPLGLEPLYYARLSGGGIALCSSGTALLKLPGVSRAYNRKFCAEIVLLLPHQPGDSFFEHVCELPRGCWLEWHDGSLEIRRYHWIGRPPNHQHAADRINQFGKLFRAAVARASVTSSELAVTLSGGLDSSSVFRVAHAQPCTNVRAISAVFPNDPETREDEYLDAALSGTHVQSLRFEPNVPFNLEQSLTLAEDPTWIPMLSIMIACAHQARALGAECVLTGEYGDFVGGSVATPAAWLLRHGHWFRAWHELKGAGGSLLRQTSRFARLALRLLVGPRWLRRTPADSLDRMCRQIADMMSPSLRSMLDIGDRLRALHTRRPPDEEPGPEAYETFFDGLGSRFTRATWLVERLCAVRLEHPFCDPDLVSWSSGLFFDERRSNGQNRAAFRRAMAGTIPERILKRTSKARFCGPHSRYFDKVERAVSGPKSLWPLSEILEIDDEVALLGASSRSLPVRHRILGAQLLAAWLRMHGGFRATEST